MKKNNDRKQLVIHRETIRELKLQDLGRVDGGQNDKTLGICGDSRGTYCPESKGQLCGTL